MSDVNNILSAFDQSTEAGRMMAALYGGKRHPNIEYPKLTTKSKRAGANENWRPGGGRSQAVDPRDSTRRKVQVAAPRVGRGKAGKKWAAIDLAPKRRGEGEIRVELDKMAMQSASYRPPHRHDMAAEKSRLGEINAYLGGKILPNEMTAHAMAEVPSQTRRRVKEEKRVKELRMKRAGVGQAPAAAVAALTPDQEMRKEIEKEIAERNQYIDQMVALGKGGSQAVREVAGEIQSRGIELAKMEKKAGGK